MGFIGLDNGTLGRRFGESKTAPVDLESLFFLNLGLFVRRKAGVVMRVMFVGRNLGISLGISILVGGVGIATDKLDKGQANDD